MIRRPPRSTLFPYTTPSDLGVLGNDTVRGGAGSDSLGDGASGDSTRTCCSEALETTPSPAACCSAERRSEEHTSELQSRQYLVCRLLLEKKTDHELPLR